MEFNKSQQRETAPKCRSPAMDALNQILKAAPETALFAALALGHALGRLKLGSFSLGGVAGSLIVALVIGQLTGVILPEALKAVCFALFIYAVGFKSGPEFFGGLNRASLKLVLSSVVQCVVALIATVVVAKVCGFGKGFSAGVGAGALTQTAMLGTAGDALTRLGFSPEQLAQFNSQMAVGFAITYVFGTVGVIIFLRSVAPRLLGVDVKQAAHELEAELSDGGKTVRPGYITPFVPVVSRAFEVTGRNGANRTVGELEKQFDRATIERVMREEEAIEHKPELVLKSGDVVGVAGRLSSVVAAGELIGEEVESKEALSFPVKVVSVVITDKRIAGKTLRQVRDSFSNDEIQGVYVLSIKRQGLTLPILPKTQVRRGDVIELAGRPAEVDRVAAVLGFADTGGGRSDLAYHTLAIVVGTLLGLMTVVVGGIPVTLGLGGGVLVAGLCFGWWHARYPVHGALPGPAQWILSEFGLSAFAAVIGLSAGPKAIAAIQEQGVALLIAGGAVTIIPLVVALYFGRFVLRLNPVVLLGALCGGQTVAAALNAVNEETESMTPVLGFTVTYAISNVLLAVWGPVIVALT
jgi:putative transport protein